MIRRRINADPVGMLPDERIPDAVFASAGAASDEQEDEHHCGGAQEHHRIPYPVTDVADRRTERS